MSQPQSNARALAVSILEQLELRGGYSNLALDAALAKAHLDPRDAGLVTTIVYGVLQHQLTLDYDLAPFIKDRKLDLWVRILLRTAVFQLVYLDKIPARAIFYESTEIAKTRGHVGLAKFVTGVLRAFQRDGAPSLDDIEDDHERLSIATSTPLWLVDRLIAQQGMAKATSILSDIDRPSAAALRVNTTRTTREALQQALALEFTLTPSEVSPVGLTSEGGHLVQTYAFSAGDYTMQDESSQLVAPSLAIEPDNLVLDACAAPGGKTTHIAEYLDPDKGGRVIALDLHPHKVRLIDQNARRLGLQKRIDSRVMDARQAGDEFAEETFDRILVDAPCSGLGLMRRKPEIRYAKQPSDLEALPAIQLAILKSVAPLLKRGGRLTYSTCTIVNEENQDVVAAFLAASPDFEQVAVPGAEALIHAHGAPALQLFPDDYGTDGFFIASFVRK
ncbi:16S rRNA (cytosine(967)-C(5))-methyltransferase RsmB [Lacticaseibacillus yichunensis]|uniref:16S rRNA (cytosine(967)-C(5))-methyltransferase n=1 Tax=Lacticaseibacillus yichunensis TaxID=2486015 RepID=A0ABW4CPU1_9LACO|nr:16S rRNA (cytosine(967)-C(5))-methyltransferase RsmB [Lacticaseibacillus yichunensis]